MTARLLLFGGIDPSGGAGLTLDAVVAAWHGCRAAPLVTALTVQNRHAFRERSAPPAGWLAAACTAALDDGPVHAVKVGMLADAATVADVAAVLRPLAGAVPIVVDPVLVSTAAGPAASRALAAAYREHLFGLASLLLPNGPERAALGDLSATAAVLAKGGHGDGELSVDELQVRGAPPLALARPRLPVGRVRGTGCALATAVAARLAHGASLEAACRGAGDWLHAWLRALGPAAPDAVPRPLPLAAAPPVGLP